jgi:UDP:flavonoid glycosyltransferase YjiC (YdhE family)
VANFLISTMPASGHVNPALPLAAELVRRGHQVWWHTGTGYADQVAAAGAHLVPFVHTLDFDQLPVQPDPGDKGMAAGVTALRKLFIDRMPGQYQDYRAITNQFPADVVLADLCCLGAGALHDAGGPVYATLGINPLVTPDPEIPRWGKGAPPATSPARRLGNRLEHLLGRVLFMPKPTALLNQARAGIGLPPLPPGSNLGDVLRSPFLHLMPTTEAFEYPRKHLPPQVHFVGPRRLGRGRHRPADRHADRRPDLHRRPHGPAAALLPRQRTADPGRLRHPPARKGGGRAFGTPRCEQVSGAAHDQHFKELVDRPRRFGACCTWPESGPLIRPALPPATQRPGWPR